MPRVYLPRSYLEGFAAPPMRGEGGRAAWVYRAAAGEWKRAPVAAPAAGERHFNQVEDEALHKAPRLDEALAAVADDVAGLVRGKIAGGEPLAPAEREVAASFLALLGVRLSPRFAHIDEEEAVAGWHALAAVLQEMGWVFWRAPDPLYFITSSSPFLVAFPSREEEFAPTADIRSPSTEVTLPLSSGVALHATWKRRGELWRRAGEDALLEINGRTCQRARAFLLAPQPSVPG